jgi:hypothetical protein
MKRPNRNSRAREALKKTPKKRKSGVMRKVRKPMAPPARVEDDLKRYKRERERERIRREEAGIDESGER